MCISDPHAGPAARFGDLLPLPVEGKVKPNVVDLGRSSQQQVASRSKEEGPKESIAAQRNLS